MSCLRYIIKNVFKHKTDNKIPEHLKNWFQTEYGKNWKLAYHHYIETGSIHYGNRFDSAL